MNLKNILKYTQKLNVLYVEDNLEILEATADIYEDYFANVTIACNGEEGYDKYLSYFNEHKKYYDLVITDINMPKMDGVEMSKLILLQNKAQHILVISAHNESERLQELISIGISNFIHKPLSLVQFSQIILKIGSDIQNEKDKINKYIEINREKTELEILNYQINNHRINTKNRITNNQIQIRFIYII